MQPLTDTEEKRQRDAELKRKNFTTLVTAIHNAVSANNKRMGRIQDPVTRNLIPIYMISSIVDVLSVAISSSIDPEMITEENERKIAAIANIVNVRLDSLIEWIQSPIYAPDHPVGREMMSGAAKGFSDEEKKQLLETIRALTTENEELKKELRAATTF